MLLSVGIIFTFVTLCACVNVCNIEAKCESTGMTQRENKEIVQSYTLNQSSMIVLS